MVIPIKMIPLLFLKALWVEKAKANGNFEL
jgi:hypothetical protein